MKNTIKKIILMFFLMVSPILISNVLADDPPGPGQGLPGGGGGSPVGQGTPVGGGAPIDGGFSILLAMGAIYGGSKIYKVIRTEVKKSE
jgi:hypothetical protein